MHEGVKTCVYIVNIGSYKSERKREKLTNTWVQPCLWLCNCLYNKAKQTNTKLIKPVRTLQVWLLTLYCHLHYLGIWLATGDGQIFLLGSPIRERLRDFFSCFLERCQLPPVFKVWVCLLCIVMYSVNTANFIRRNKCHFTLQLFSPEWSLLVNINMFNRQLLLQKIWIKEKNSSGLALMLGANRWSCNECLEHARLFISLKL